MNKNEKVIYSINIEDVQTVAKQEFDRELSYKELKVIEEEIGDYINWYDIIELTIRNANIEGRLSIGRSWSNLTVEI